MTQDMEKWDCKVNYALDTSSADSMGHGWGARGLHFYIWLGTAGRVSRRTANKKLTKLY